MAGFYARGELAHGPGVYNFNIVKLIEIQSGAYTDIARKRFHNSLMKFYNNIINRIANIRVNPSPESINGGGIIDVPEIGDDIELIAPGPDISLDRKYGLFVLRISNTGINAGQLCFCRGIGKVSHIPAQEHCKTRL